MFVLGPEVWFSINGDLETDIVVILPNIPIFKFGGMVEHGVLSSIITVENKVLDFHGIFFIVLELFKEDDSSIVNIEVIIT